MRQDNRKNDEIRPVSFQDDFIENPLAAVLIEQGRTKVLCTVSFDAKVPPFLRGSGRGWVTAEYSMLPGSTNTRKQRDINRLRLDGRSSEIQRLIGRSLRTVVDFEALGENTLVVDCDVLQADGGTRCASINGGYRALALACRRLVEQGILKSSPLTGQVGAISVGMVKGQAMADLCYLEDSAADVDMNVIMNENNEFIEIQGTGEEKTFTRAEMNQMLDHAEKAIQTILKIEEANL
ncbi:MAG: ribonuclease PH [Clostridium sp.]|nr:ribonuclease PH [Clostridium sp.]